MNPKTSKLLLILASCLACGTLAAQSTIFSDDFSSGSSPGNGWLNQFGSELDSQTTVPTTSVSGGELVHDSTNENSGTFVRSGVSKNFSTVSLVNPGDFLELSFDARATNYDDDGFGFRVALTTLTTTQDGNFARAGSDAPGISTHMGITPGDENGRFWSHDGTDSIMADGQTLKNNAFDASPSNTATPDTFVFRLERDGSGGIVTSISENGSNLATETFASGNVSTYDFSSVSFGVRSDGTAAGAGDQFYLDNVSVTTIPEPRTLTLMSLALLVLAGMRHLNKRR